MYDDQAFASFRSWASGEVSARPWELIALSAVLILVAFMVLLPNFSSIDSLGLGEDMGRALGAHPRRTWLLAGIGTVILSAVSVTLAGPIFFLGLAAPMVVRWNTGPKARDLTIWSGVAGAGILLAADIIARVIIPPQEISAANVCGLIGAPLFVVAAKRARLISP